MADERPQDIVGRGYDAGAEAYASWQEQITGDNRLERVEELFALPPASRRARVGDELETIREPEADATFLWILARKAA